jgi:hypothetical protein
MSTYATPGGSLHGAGHGVERADWPMIVDAIAKHTAARDRTS